MFLGKTIIEDEKDLVEIRDVLRIICTRVEFPQVEVIKILTAASELTRYIFDTTTNATVNYELVKVRGNLGLKITFNGQAGDHVAVGDGVGVTGAKKLVDEFFYDPKANSGVILSITKWKNLEKFPSDDVIEQLKLDVVQASEKSIVEALMSQNHEISELLAEVRQKNQQLEDTNIQITALNKELEAFSYSVSHDLRAPLRAIDGFSKDLLEDHADKLDAEGQDDLHRVCAAAQKMGDLINDMLTLSRVTHAPLNRESVNLTAIANDIIVEIQSRNPQREVNFVAETDLKADCDAALVRIVLQNLLENAWKYTSKHPRAYIEFGAYGSNETTTYFVRDDGAGFDMAYAGKLFGAFQRLHSPSEFEGTGIGLATVQRVINRHGGRVWAESAVEQGATFYFTLTPTGSETCEQ